MMPAENLPVVLAYCDLVSDARISSGGRLTSLIVSLFWKHLLERQIPTDCYANGFVTSILVTRLAVNSPSKTRLQVEPLMMWVFNLLFKASKDKLTRVEEDYKWISILVNSL